MRLPALIGMSLAVSGTVCAQDVVSRGPVPPWVKPSALLPVPSSTSGVGFFRRQDMQVHFSERGQAQYFGYRVKILHTSGLALGNISIAWDPAAGSPTVHEIKIIRADQTIDVLKNASFEILRREDKLEAAMLDGTSTAVLRIPDLRIGDELEVGITTFSSDPTLGNRQSGVLALGASPPAGRYRVGLSWDPDHAPVIKATPDMQAAMQKSERAVDFRFDNPQISSPPEDAPLRFRWQRAIEFSDFADWAAVSRHFAPIYAKAALPTSNSPIKAEARKIAAAHKGSLARASAALKLVQQDVRYIYVGLNGGNLTPASADETWQRRYGDCKGKTALLLALLSELGIKAEAVIVNANGADDGLDQRLPVLQLFDHVLVRAQIDGATYWMDGTLPPVAPPSLEPLYPLKWVLPLTPSGSPLQKLAWQPARVPDELSVYEIDARAGFDKPAKIMTTQIVRGVKGLQQQTQFSAVTPAQLLEAFRQTAIGDTWQQIDDVQWRYDERAQASVLTISGVGSVDWETEDGGGRSLALPGGGFNPPERRVRPEGSSKNLPFYSAPEYSCHVTTVRLPADTAAKRWSSVAGFDTRIFGRHYHRAWEMREGSIRMIRGLRVDQPEIEAAAALRDNDRIAAFDNSMGSIYYDPSAEKADVGKGEKVPATFERDWTANDVPCLSSPRS